MTTQRKKWEPLAYSGIGVIAVFLILVAVGVIGRRAKVRLDLTEGSVYTLSDGTKKVLGKLDAPVTIHYYASQSDAEMPVQLKTYAKRVEDLLDEYRQASNGKVQIVKFDPQPDSDAEESARIDGVEGQSLSQGGVIGLGEKTYLGLAVLSPPEKVTLPFLDPGRENLLEYDLTRAISQVAHPQKQNLGVMSALQVFGQFNPMMARMGGGAGQQEPWIIINELKRDYNVTQVPMSTAKIDDSISVLLLIYPAKISDEAQFAIDQFLLRGGRVVALLDPLSLMDARNSMNQQNMLAGAAANGATMEKLLKAWGLSFEMAKVVADKNYVTMIRKANGPAPEATWLSLTPEAISSQDVITSQIDSLLLVAAGVFSGTPADGLKMDVLLKTSPNSMLVDKMMAQFGADVSKDFVPSGKEMTLGLRLAGKFKTAFPEGKPAGATENKDQDDKDASPKDPAPPDAKPADSLKESQKDSVVVLLGDSDFAADQFSVRVQDFFGQRIAQPFNGNLNLVLNAVEQLMGDSTLIEVRSRAVKNRPFTLVKKIQAQAEEQYRTKIKQFEDDLQKTQQKLTELQQGKEKNQRIILSKEQQDEIKSLHDKELQVKRELKVVRKQLRRDIDSLETRLKWINIAGMALLVTVVGVALALVKRKQTAAK